MPPPTHNRLPPPAAQELGARVRALSPARLALLEQRLAARQTSNTPPAQRAHLAPMTPNTAVSILGRLDELSDGEVDGLLEQINPHVAAESLAPRAIQHEAGGSTGPIDDANELLSRLDGLADGEVDHLLNQLMQNDE
jgi:hypothetical protein